MITLQTDEQLSSFKRYRNQFLQEIQPPRKMDPIMEAPITKRKRTITTPSSDAAPEIGTVCRIWKTTGKCTRDCPNLVGHTKTDDRQRIALLKASKKVPYRRPQMIMRTWRWKSSPTIQQQNEQATPSSTIHPPISSPKKKHPKKKSRVRLRLLPSLLQPTKRNQQTTSRDSPLQISTIRILIQSFFPSKKKSRNYRPKKPKMHSTIWIWSKTKSIWVSWISSMICNWSRRAMLATKNRIRVSTVGQRHPNKPTCVFGRVIPKSQLPPFLKAFQSFSSMETEPRLPYRSRVQIATWIGPSLQLCVSIWRLGTLQWTLSLKPSVARSKEFLLSVARLMITWNIIRNSAI